MGVDKRVGGDLDQPPAQAADPEAMMSEQVTVIHGAMDAVFDALAGKRVGSVRRALQNVFGITDHAQALVNGRLVPGDYSLRAGDILEFALTGWGSKGALEPDELERFIRRIDSTVKRIAEEGLFRLRLNETETEIFKVLQDDTVKGEALARKLGLYFNSNFKATIAALVRHGLLDNNADGYFVPPAVSRYLKATGAV
jgi:hypothetical protein